MVHEEGNKLKPNLVFLLFFRLRRFFFLFSIFTSLNQSPLHWVEKGTRGEGRWRIVCNRNEDTRSVHSLPLSSYFDLHILHLVFSPSSFELLVR